MRASTVIVTLYTVAACLLLWVLIPYNNYVLENAYIADSYLPPAAVMMVLLLVFGINPLLRRIRPEAPKARLIIAWGGAPGTRQQKREEGCKPGSACERRRGPVRTGVPAVVRRRAAL